MEQVKFNLRQGMDFVKSVQNLLPLNSPLNRAMFVAYVQIQIFTLILVALLAALLFSMYVGLFETSNIFGVYVDSLKAAVLTFLSSDMPDDDEFVQKLASCHWMWLLWRAGAFASAIQLYAAVMLLRATENGNSAATRQELVGYWQTVNVIFFIIEMVIFAGLYLQFQLYLIGLMICSVRVSLLALAQGYIQTLH